MTQLRSDRIADNLLFALFVGLYLAGLWITFSDKLMRVGHPDIGWVMDGTNISPTRWDAADAGLRGGGRANDINGIALDRHSIRHSVVPNLRTRVGDTNTITLRGPGGGVQTITIPVRAWTWEDVVFAEGATFGVGALFAIVGITTFILRPYRTTSWALLILCCSAGGLFSCLFVQIGPHDTLRELYFRLMIGLTSFAPYHGALALPVVHPLLLRRPLIVVPIYAAALALTIFQFVGWYTDWPGPFVYSGVLDTVTLLVGLLLFIGRCAASSVKARDPLIQQRARILLAGAVVGLGPIIVASFLRTSLDWPVLDIRVAVWSMGFFLVALVHVTLREELLNARIAVQRALIYAAVVVLLTIVAALLVGLRSYAVSMLLLPLLYWWPRFSAGLDHWLYPKRARFPELIRSIGSEFTASPTVGDVLQLLAEVPARMCDARTGVAFLLAEHGEPEQVASSGIRLAPQPSLGEETLVQVLRSLRKEIARDRIAVDQQYANIADECLAGFSRFGADVLLPILSDARVVGGLAVGPRVTGDVYESAELDALSTVAQQALQAIQRISAFERLRHREREFADLKRFFPPQVIDQVMARGGAAELRSQRKLVTVVFVDLRGFTSFADSIEPEEVMSTLAEYHAAMGRRIAEFGGTLERFAGDGLMVFFNDPVDQPDHVERAARMALAMQQEVRGLREAWLRKGYNIDVGIGIQTGYATCGFVGYEGRRDYAVIGTVTNLAARLSDAARGGEVLISARVRAALPPAFAAEPLGEVTLKGFHQTHTVFRLLGEKATGRLQATAS